MAAKRSTTPSSLRPFVEHAALLMLLALIPLRAVIGETHTFEVARGLRTLDAPAGASPATTFAINALIFAVTGLVLVLRQWSGEGYRRTGAEWGAAILAVAMCISTWRAGQKHLAIIGSIDFLGFIAYFIALSQLLRRPWQVRLALTVILTTGAVMITKCAYQRFVELPETVQYYNEHKAELISQNQSNPGFIYDYEQRLKGGSMTGFFSHPNVLASYLILIILTAFGVARSRLSKTNQSRDCVFPSRDRQGAGSTDSSPRQDRSSAIGVSMASAIIPILIAIAGVITLAGAQSKGAAAALGIALVAWIIGERLSTTFRNRPRLAVGATWACLFAIAVALPVTLQIKPDSLGRSMLFRHFYWRASAAMIHDQGPWGVGAGNFGRFFTRYKDVECPEDVEDPHSWVVRAATEWGVLGLVGLVAVLVGISRRIANQSEHKAQVEESHGRPLWHVDKAPVLGQTLPDPSGAGVPTRRTNAKSGHGGPLHSSSDTWLELPEGSLHTSSIILSSAAIGLIVFAGWFTILLDAPPPYIVLTLFIPAVAWFIAFFLTAYEPASGKSISDAPLGPMLAALSAGLLGFTIHSGIDLAMFTGGAATTFFALLAIASRVRCADQYVATAPPVCAKPTTPGVGLLIASCSIAWCMSGPRLLRSHFAAQGLNLARAPSQQSTLDVRGLPLCTGNYANVASFYEDDATAIEEMLDILAPRVTQSNHFDYALSEAHVFERRDPHNALVHHYRAILYARRSELALQLAAQDSPAAMSQASRLGPQVSSLKPQDSSDLDLAIGCAREALAAHPTSPQRHMFVADLLERRASVSDSPADRMRFNADAASELQTALDLEARRIYVSPLHRMTKEMRDGLEKRIARLRSETK
ncbi:MAG: O-antigen ligase family protein [Planctomycetes bacterium]|nr:O-antigen ligase family protein [Planctomycetota bacterium]